MGFEFRASYLNISGADENFHGMISNIAADAKTFKCEGVTYGRQLKPAVVKKVE